MSATQVTIEATVKRLERVATKSPLTAAELGDKLRKNHPGEYADNRSFGRALGKAVQQGKLVRSGAKSRPQYAKPKS